MNREQEVAIYVHAKVMPTIDVLRNDAIHIATEMSEIGAAGEYKYVLDAMVLANILVQLSDLIESALEYDKLTEGMRNEQE